MLQNTVNTLSINTVNPHNLKKIKQMINITESLFSLSHTHTRTHTHTHTHIIHIQQLATQQKDNVLAVLTAADGYVQQCTQNVSISASFVNCGKTEIRVSYIFQSVLRMISCEVQIYVQYNAQCPTEPCLLLCLFAYFCFDVHVCVCLSAQLFLFCWKVRGKPEEGKGAVCLLRHFLRLLFIFLYSLAPYASFAITAKDLKSSWLLPKSDPTVQHLTLQACTTAKPDIPCSATGQNTAPCSASNTMQLLLASPQFCHEVVVSGGGVLLLLLLCSPKLFWIRV